MERGPSLRECFAAPVATTVPTDIDIENWQRKAGPPYTSRPVAFEAVREELEVGRSKSHSQRGVRGQDAKASTGTAWVLELTPGSGLMGESKSNAGGSMRLRSRCELSNAFLLVNVGQAVQWCGGLRMMEEERAAVCARGADAWCCRGAGAKKRRAAE